MNNGPSPREFWEWLRSLPANLGKTGASFYLLGFSLIIISGICALLVNIVSLDVVWRILGGGLAVMSLGVGLISLGAAYKSSTAVKAMGDSDAKMKEECKLETGVESLKGDALEKSDSGSDIDVIKKYLIGIKESLDRIDKQQTDNKKSGKYYFYYTLGFTSMAAGMGLAVAKVEYAGYGLGLFFCGFIVCMFAPRFGKG